MHWPAGGDEPSADLLATSFDSGSTWFSEAFRLWRASKFFQWLVGDAADKPDDNILAWCSFEVTIPKTPTSVKCLAQ